MQVQENPILNILNVCSLKSGVITCESKLILRKQKLTFVAPHLVLIQASALGTVVKWSWPRGSLPTCELIIMEPGDGYLVLVDLDSDIDLQLKIIDRVYFGRSTRWTCTHVWSGLFANWRQNLRIRLGSQHENDVDYNDNGKNIFADDSETVSFFRWQLRREYSCLHLKGLRDRYPVPPR